MNRLSQWVKQALFLPSIVLIIAACCAGAQNGLSHAGFFRGIHALICDYPEQAIGLLIICLQLVAMRWAGGVLNILLSLASVLLMAEFVHIILGPAIAFTGPIQALATSSGYPQLLSSFAALYWLIPVVWLLCLFSATAQVRIFCTAIVCYFLWLVLTPFFYKLLNLWQEAQEPVMPQVLDLFRNLDWMGSAFVGGFLLTFALIMSLIDTIFPVKH
ncbi:MAG: hypothetical protein IJA63_00380 [Akkermansia sp.]|nr:hypothetical protein [Akkermansia sp.]